MKAKLNLNGRVFPVSFMQDKFDDGQTRVEVIRNGYKPVYGYGSNSDEALKQAVSKLERQMGYTNSPYIQ